MNLKLISIKEKISLTPHSPTLSNLFQPFSANTPRHSEYREVQRSVSSILPAVSTVPPRSVQTVPPPARPPRLAPQPLEAPARATAGTDVAAQTAEQVRAQKDGILQRGLEPSPQDLGLDAPCCPFPTTRLPSVS